MNIHHILVPTDFSEPAREATDYALGLARAFGASVTLFHVIEDPVVYVPALGGYMPQPKEFEDFSDVALAEWVVAEDAPGVTIHREWKHGHPVSSILEFAIEHGCDMIVMGTHGRGALSHLLIGSIAERIVRKAKCPVLTVRPTCAHEQAIDPAVVAVEG
jgi:nucleotide-binding universal stress UspA family protein